MYFSAIISLHKNLLKNLLWFRISGHQDTSSKLTIETLEQGVKYAQRSQ